MLLSFLFAALEKGRFLPPDGSTCFDSHHFPLGRTRCLFFSFPRGILRKGQLPLNSFLFRSRPGRELAFSSLRNGASHDCPHARGQALPLLFLLSRYRTSGVEPRASRPFFTRKKNSPPPLPRKKPRQVFLPNTPLSVKDGRSFFFFSF